MNITSNIYIERYEMNTRFSSIQGACPLGERKNHDVLLLLLEATVIAHLLGQFER